MWQFHGDGDWIWMMAIMALIWVPIVLTVLWALGRGLASTAGPLDRERDEEDPRAIARRAYARGELSRERFIEIVDDLDQTRSAAVH